jgi:hypothetical protein
MLLKLPNIAKIMEVGFCQLELTAEANVLPAD